MNLENRFPFSYHEFQPTPKYGEMAKSPFVVVRQTDRLLDLFNQGIISNPDFARKYLENYTLQYLQDAEEGSDGLYDLKGILDEDIDLEIKEAAHHAFIVFGNLPDKLTSRFLPNGFSRRGMLQAPGTRREFLSRINELRQGIDQIVERGMNPRLILESAPPLLRTVGFFKVGSNLSTELIDDQIRKAKIEEENFDRLLKDIDI